jgi:predicted negative regulator of RcsB-dependent stress response
MEEYYNADDQAQAVKAWLKKYGVSIVIGLILGIALFYVLQFFMGKRAVADQKAAETYVILLNATASANNPQITMIANDIVKNYPKTPYASMAQFFATQVSVNAAQYDKADSQLQWIIDHSKIASFRQIARIRLARILLQQQKISDAQTVLKKVEDKTYMPLIETTTGDIYLAQKQYDNAKSAYEAALNGASSFSGLTSMLQMKLSDPQLTQITQGAKKL